MYILGSRIFPERLANGLRVLNTTVVERMDLFVGPRFEVTQERGEDRMGKPNRDSDWRIRTTHTGYYIGFLYEV